MRPIKLAANCVGVSLLVLTLVECTSTSFEQHQHAPGALVANAPKRREGKIRDSTRDATSSQAESVTFLRAAKQQNLSKPPVQDFTQQPQARSTSPALQRLIAQSQATKVDTISSGEQVSRARSLSESGASKNPEASSSHSREEEASSTSRSSARQAKCVITTGRRRGLREILTSAKNLATGGFLQIEQRAGNILWFGSNVLATLIPLASLLGLGPATSTKPSVAAGSLLTSHAPDNLVANQTSYTQATSTSKQTGSLLSPQNLIVSLASNAGGLQSRVEHVMGWLERSIEHLPNFPRLHPQECVKRCICEAHADPTKYGALGLTLRLLFPATQLAVTEGQDNMEYKVINKYRHAAGYGMARRVMDTSSDGNSTSGGGGGGGGWTSGNNYAATAACKEKYEDCLVSLLDVAQNLVDFFLNKS